MITFAVPFLELLHKKKVKMGPKEEFTKKHRMFGAKNNCQPRKFYTNAGCDG